MKLRVLLAPRHKTSVCILAYLVILSSIDRSSKMKVGRVILDRSAPGRSCDMMCERTI